MKTISIITATFNSVKFLPNLITSLREQTDTDFKWLVSDGGSNDGTLEILKEIDDLNISLYSRPDFGIYDALNRAIKACDTDYYLILGSDDTLYPEAISNFKKTINEGTGADIIAASIIMDNRVVRPNKGKSCIYGQFEYVANHSVGTLFKKDLHGRFGFYSPKFPIAADQLFIKKCCQGGAKVQIVDYVAGEFSLEGVSSTDIAGNLCEFFRVQLLTEKNKYLQVVLFILRLINNLKKL